MGFAYSPSIRRQKCRRFCSCKSTQDPQRSTSFFVRPQSVQHQSIKNNKIPQISISNGIWFGTRGSEVQILSPRPFISSSYNRHETTIWFWPRCSSWSDPHKHCTASASHDAAAATKSSTVSLNRQDHVLKPVESCGIAWVLGWLI